MGIFDFFKRSKSANTATANSERRSLSLSSLDGWALNPTSSGVNITHDTALNISAVWACVSVIAQDISSLPFQLMKETENGAEKAKRHTLYNILKNSPNPEMSSMNYWESVLVHLLLHGNHFSEIERSLNGSIKAIWPLSPDKVKILRNTSGELVYQYKDVESKIDRVFKKEDVFHVTGFSSNGISGISPITKLRDTIALSKASENEFSNYFKTSKNPAGHYTLDRMLSDEEWEVLKVRLAPDTYAKNLADRSSIKVLEGGLKFEPTRYIQANDLELLSSRKFGIEEIARIYRVSPHVIGHLDKASFNNISELSRSHVVYSLRSWCVRIEQAVQNQLIKDRNHFLRINLDALLRGSLQERAEYYSKAVSFGWLTRNEVRQLENHDRLEELDKPLTPLNLSTNPHGSTPTTPDEGDNDES